MVIDLDYLSQRDFVGFHRSGWAYAITGLRYLAHPWRLHRLRSKEGEEEEEEEEEGVQGQQPLLFDTCVDRSFHWGRRVLESAGVVPYRRPWAGVVHHTFDTTHSPHNCAQLLATPSFRASLSTCVALFALSHHLARQLREALDALHLPCPPPPVYAVPHPTEVPPLERRFTMLKFESNPDRMAVQVGAWLRDPYAIYDLHLPIPMTPITPQGATHAHASASPPIRHKAALRGRDMNRYFPPEIPDSQLFLLPALATAAKNMIDGPQQQQPPMLGGELCRPAHPQSTVVAPILPPTGNLYVDGLLHAAERKEESVRVLEHLDDNAYDELLSRNVVFLRLVDASAVNTVVECAARDTPIFVNRHPALEEVLGHDYPGFYDCPAHAAALLSSWDAIKAAHTHIAQRVDKHALLSLSSFVDAVHNCLAHASALQQD